MGHCRLLLLLGRARQKGGFHSDHDEEEDPGEKDDEDEDPGEEDDNGGLSSFSAGLK